MIVVMKTNIASMSMCFVLSSVYVFCAVLCLCFVLSSVYVFCAVLCLCVLCCPLSMCFYIFVYCPFEANATLVFKTCVLTLEIQ